MQEKLLDLYGEDVKNLYLQLKQLNGDDFSPLHMFSAGWKVYAKNEVFGDLVYEVSSINISKICIQFNAASFNVSGTELIDEIEFVAEDIGKYVFLTQEECSKAMYVSFKGDDWDAKGYCTLTEEMDTYILGGANSVFKTYLMDYGTREEVCKDDSGGHIYAIRFPGATCGNILTDKNGYIEKIEFYPSSCYDNLHVFDRDMETLKEKYIGRKIVMLNRK